jgi:hypothetical protein
MIRKKVEKLQPERVFNRKWKLNSNGLCYWGGCVLSIGRPQSDGSIFAKENRLKKRKLFFYRYEYKGTSLDEYS